LRGIEAVNFDIANFYCHVAFSFAGFWGFAIIGLRFLLGKELLVQIHLKTADLKKYLPLLLAATDQDASLRILSHFMIDAGAGGKEVSISACDLNSYMTVKLPAVKIKGGRIAIPAARLSAFVTYLTDQEEVGICSLKGSLNNLASITAGKRECNMPTMPVASWPKFPVIPEHNQLVLPSVSISRLLDKTMFSIAQPESRYELNGALLTIEDEMLRMVTTDGHTLAYVGTKDFGGKMETVCIRRETLDLLRKCQPCADLMDIVKGAEHTHFIQGPISISSKAMTGRFPDYKSVLPKPSTNITASVKAETLLNAVLSAMQFAYERSDGVHLKVADKKLWILAECLESGKFSENIEAECSGQEIDMLFNADYLIRHLKHVTGTVQMDFTEKDTAATFRLADDPDYTYLVMPMRA
jgi:DNA polymerase III subunit beta